MDIQQYVAPFLPSLSRKRKPNMTFNHKFIGLGTHKSECKVEIWTDPKYAVVVFTDINKGTSVTNGTETLVEEIFREYLFPSGYLKDCVLFCETYDLADMISVIIPEWNHQMVRSVEFKYLGKIVD